MTRCACGISVGGPATENKNNINYLLCNLDNKLYYYAAWRTEGETWRNNINLSHHGKCNNTVVRIAIRKLIIDEHRELHAKLRLLYKVLHHDLIRHIIIEQLTFKLLQS